MTRARAVSIALRGVDAQVVTIEADIGRGLPSLQLPDLPGSSWQETRDRVRAAVLNSGEAWPDGRVIITLSPAQMPVPSSVLDLAVAAAVLTAGNMIPSARRPEPVLLGELALDGRLRAVRGTLPAVLAARNAGYTTVVVPAEALPEARLVTGIEVLGAATLRQALAWLRGQGTLTRPTDRAPASPRDRSDLRLVTGQGEAPWALEVAAAGGHHLLLIGPADSGKTLLAQCLPGLLPPLSTDEALEVTAIESLAGTLDDDHPSLSTRPFIAPHHSVSVNAMIGGGTVAARPGAVTRAHRGVLFLDDCPEFSSRVFEALRAPIEDGEVRLARPDGLARYPARFQMVLAATGCPCGSAHETDCVCAPLARRRYLGRLSGPLLDRVDLVAPTHPLTDSTTAAGDPDTSAAVRERVLVARRRAAERWRADGYDTNAEAPGPVLRRRVPLSPEATAPLEDALRMGRISARGADRALRVAWTICDLRAGRQPTDSDIRAALDFRFRR
ncbi:YifB family Mg chelatase-like AAA ATPase [Nocardia sputi]|uniref:YifB family Mg chelatase-like AAA ATPase n=1 Tax=Nocardia sputi TaxID=2943705 RepID=UPI0020BDD5B3|nr:YifB family Mg chelatase-like AAA ATPase [Nocardia sputi]